MGSSRHIGLECARGIASVIVFCHHFVLAFYPWVKSSVADGSLGLAPFLAVINGSSAITFFFVLSGFVLSVRFYQDLSMARLVTSVLKRLPRLVVPVGASILLGYLVLAFLPPFYQQAAALSGSDWLGGFGNAQLPANFEPTLLDALRQSVAVFLHRWDFYYNSNMWTMVYEFYGSMLVFGIVGAVGLLRCRSFWPVSLAHLLAFIGVHSIVDHIAPFVLGSYLAYLYADRPALFVTGRTGGRVLLVVALALFAVSGWMLDLLASALLIALPLGNKGWSDRLSGRVGIVLGQISLPLYLVHTLVIVSVSSAGFVAMTTAGMNAWLVAALTLGLTLVAAGLVCIPLVLLDIGWVRLLNRIARSISVQIAKLARPAAAPQD